MAGETADLIFTNGVVQTVDAANSIAEAVADRVPEPVQVGDHLAHVLAREQLEDVLHDRPVRHRHQRLRDLVRERAKARAQPRGHHHRPHRRQAIGSQPVYDSQVKQTGEA